MYASVTIPFDTTAPGDFTIVTNLGLIPTSVIIEYTSGGAIWFNNPRFDADNLYMVASDAGVTGFVIVYGSCGDC